MSLGFCSQLYLPLATGLWLGDFPTLGLRVAPGVKDFDSLTSPLSLCA